jgi:hypothetical protein
MSSKFASPFMAKSPLHNDERVSRSVEKKGKRNKVKNTVILDEADADSSKQDSDKVVIHKETWKDDPNKRSGRTVKIKRKVVSKKRGERAKKRLKKKNERNKEQR